MSSTDLLRIVIPALACVVAGATVVVFARYTRQWWRAPAAGRATPRHVAEVSLGALGLVVGNGYAIYATVGEPGGPPLSRLLLYLVSLLLLLVGVVDVGYLHRRHPRAADHTQDSAEGRHRRRAR